ncbi:MAG: hypothetical protein ACRCXT_12610 [Paraclostridium sp.]
MFFNFKKNKELDEKTLLKKEAKKVNKSILDIMPIKDIGEDDFFETEYGYMNIYQIETKDVYSLNNDEVFKHVSDFSSFIRVYKDDFKILCMQYPINTKAQQDYLIGKLNKCQNDKQIYFLEKRIKELKFLEKYRFNKEFYIFIYAKDNKTKFEKEDLLFRVSNSSLNIKKLSVAKKVNILFKLNNQNSTI